MLNKYEVSLPGGKEKAYIYAGSEETAMEILRANFGPNPRATLRYLREATRAEREAVKNTGGKCPRRRNV